MDTVNQLVTDFQSRFSDVTSAEAIRLANMIHKRILARLGIRDTSIDISLTAGTREYDLAETAIQIRAAYYVRSATAGDFQQLDETSTDKMDLLDTGWRNRTTQSQPRLYFVNSLVNSNTSKKRIGFDPIPDTTTSGGYPKVTLYITQHTDLVGADTLPTQVQDSQIYLDGMSWLFAKEQGLADRDEWKVEFEKRCSEEAAFINRILRQDVSIYYPTWIRGRAIR